MFLEHFNENQSENRIKKFSHLECSTHGKIVENLQFEFLSRNETLSADTYVFRNWNVLPMEAKTRGKTF